MANSSRNAQRWVSLLTATPTSTSPTSGGFCEDVEILQGAQAYAWLQCGRGSDGCELHSGALRHCEIKRQDPRRLQVRPRRHRLPRGGVQPLKIFRGLIRGRGTSTSAKACSLACGRTCQLWWPQETPVCPTRRARACPPTSS